MADVAYIPGEAGRERRPAIGYAMVISAALLFALNGTVSKVVLQSGISSLELTQVRATGAFLGFALVLLLTRRESLRLTRREVPYSDRLRDRGSGARAVALLCLDRPAADRDCAPDRVHRADPDRALHVYVSQTDRGEILIGAEIEPYTAYRGTSTFPFLEYSARHALELFPQLESARVLRQWTGLCDISPDFSPILGITELDGFLVSAGWGTYGFKAAPIVGTTLAELVATKRTPPLIAPFALERFSTDTLVSELAAAAVSH